MDGQPVKPIDVLQATDRSNCGECGLPTCMAFAVQVAQGKRAAGDCPRIAPEVAARIDDRRQTASDPAAEAAAALAPLKSRIAALDFAASAERLGGELRDDRLVVRMLGRAFALDRDGELHAMCHINPWVHFPLLAYALECRGAAPSGAWVGFGELPGAQSWARFFDWRCERELQKLAEADFDLLCGILSLFCQGLAPERIEADRAYLLAPLPRVPLLFTCWAPAADFPPRVRLLFDRGATENLGVEALFRLSSGLVEMFKRIAIDHGGG